MSHARVRTGLIAAGLLVGLSFPRVTRGTVAEQRARLPPPADCSDPITGVWKSHRYRARYSQWTEFELRVYRVAGTADQLHGTITNHSWYADASQEQPGPCDGQLRYVISMDAEGFVRGDYIDFHAIGEWRMDKVLCGEWRGNYYLDHFTGDIAHDLHEFQSVNNDGATSVNEPTVFRRISCAEAAPLPPGMEPPPTVPPQVGCGW